MLCEGVCRTWRAILRCSQLHSSSTGSGLSGIWGKVTIKFEKEFPEQSRSIKCDGEWSSHTTFSVKASGCSLSQQERTFVAWMRQRSVGAESINLWCDFYTQDPGWVFAELVLAISSSGGQFSAQPPVTLESGKVTSTVVDTSTCGDCQFLLIPSFWHMHKICVPMLCRG